MVRSALDGIPVANKAFPLNNPTLAATMTVVGACTTCGNPIYGQATTSADQYPVTQRTCMCHTGMPKSLADVTATK